MKKRCVMRIGWGEKANVCKAAPKHTQWSTEAALRGGKHTTFATLKSNKEKTRTRTRQQGERADRDQCHEFSLPAHNTQRRTLYTPPRSKHDRSQRSMPLDFHLRYAPLVLKQTHNTEGEARDTERHVTLNWRMRVVRASHSYYKWVEWVVFCLFVSVGKRQRLTCTEADSP